jgi:phage/plasmid-associated DNA primase
VFYDTEIAPKNIQVRKMFNYDFKMGATPLLDKYFSYQFDDQKDIDFIYFQIGRCLTKLNDNFQFMTMQTGIAGTGKSMISKLIAKTFNVGQYGILTSNLSKSWGLGDIADRQVLICDDLPHDIASVIDKGDFLAMMSRGMIHCSVRYKSPFDVPSWDIPTWINSNVYPNYKDESGNIVRRIVIIPFENTIAVEDIDTDLEKTITQNELSMFIHKSRSMYLDYAHTYKGQDITVFQPATFKLASDELRFEINDSYRFAKTCLKYKKDNDKDTKITKMKMNHAFKEFIKSTYHTDKVDRSNKLTVNDVLRAHPEFEFIKENVCKACLKKHERGCCDDYNRTARTKKEYYLNIEINEMYDGSDEIFR